jgi:hypothetical protein
VPGRVGQDPLCRASPGNDPRSRTCLVQGQIGQSHRQPHCRVGACRHHPVPLPRAPLRSYVTGLGADGASAGIRSAASVSGEWWSSTHGEWWSSTQEAASRSSWAAARACSDVSIDPCSASTHTTTSPSSFCTVAISTEEPSSVRTVDQRGPSWPPGSTSQSACLVWHQLGHEPRLKRSSAMVMVPVYPVPTTTRRRMAKMWSDRETCGIREASGRDLGSVVVGRQGPR